MKGLLRSFIVHTAVLWFIATNVGGIEFANDPKILLSASLALTLVDTLIKPFINLLLLPFNLVTLGVFRWVSSVAALYGLATEYFIIPSLTLSVLGAYILIAILVSFTVSLLFWLLH